MHDTVRPVRFQQTHQILSIAQQPAPQTRGSPPQHPPRECNQYTRFFLCTRIASPSL